MPSPAKSCHAGHVITQFFWLSLKTILKVKNQKQPQKKKKPNSYVSPFGLIDKLHLLFKLVHSYYYCSYYYYWHYGKSTDYVVPIGIQRLHSFWIIRGSSITHRAIYLIKRSNYQKRNYYVPVCNQPIFDFIIPHRKISWENHNDI